ncbi:MAG: PAS domain-containing protein [Acidobacteria bacterium]|nr:PAS domain-containing protein [Acidobacteriota bacterium]
MTDEVPRTFRRDSRLFLSVALLLILFLNFVTLLFFRNATEWGSRQTERRAAEILNRMALPYADPAEALDRAALGSDVLFVASYDAKGRRVRGSSHGLEAPPVLPTVPPAGGEVVSEWRSSPRVLLATRATRTGFSVVAVDPGPGGALRSYAQSLSLVVPAAGALLVVLAWLYLRSLLAPLDRLLQTAGGAPPGPGLPGAEPSDERHFLIARFEATIAALSEKERELERLARAEKERADDMEIAARTLARNLPTGLLSVDRSGAVVELNEAGREILGVALDARGEPFARVLAKVPEFEEVITAVLERREAVGRRETHWGPERVLGVTATPATGADGRFLGVLALFSDLSEVRRLEARVALARHLADLGEVSAGAAHEFRNAAAAIDGFADLALRSPERAADHLKSIRREAQEMTRVTSDFLLFARPDEFVPAPVSLDAVAEGAATEVERAFPGTVVERAGEFPEVAGSAVLLRRAVANLVRNAAEATPAARRSEPSAIVISGRRNGEEVSLAVADRGPGVDPDAREKIFLPFYSSKPDGSGFGLAIVARIAEIHGGTVEIAARPGGGAVFTLRLAGAPDSSARAAVPAGQPSGSRSSS